MLPLHNVMFCKKRNTQPVVESIAHIFLNPRINTLQISLHSAKYMAHKHHRGQYLKPWLYYPAGAILRHGHSAHLLHMRQKVCRVCALQRVCVCDDTMWGATRSPWYIYIANFLSFFLLFAVCPAVSTDAELTQYTTEVLQHTYHM